MNAKDLENQVKMDAAEAAEETVDATAETEAEAY